MTTGPGAAACEESWAVGTDSAGRQVSVYEACAVSCPKGDTTRECTAPGPSRTCADANADGTPTLFSCPDSNLIGAPDSAEGLAYIRKWLATSSRSRARPPGCCRPSSSTPLFHSSCLLNPGTLSRDRGGGAFMDAYDRPNRGEAALALPG